MPLSDKMLAGGCALHVEAIHGEPVLILTGLDAGKTFIGTRETESDLILTGDLGPDPRPKRMLRFRDGAVPRLNSQDRVQTEDGRKWLAILQPGDGFLTTDFELMEIIDGKDT